MLRASKRMRRTIARRGHSLRLLLPILSLALAIWACGAPPYVTHKPASDLALTIAVMGQYGDSGDAANVEVRVQMFETRNPQPVEPPTSAKLTCNGVNATPAYNINTRPCPRQPPGGFYIFTYTDEHGVVTTATIPVPLGKLALLSPQTGSLVPIPRAGTMDMVYEAPVAPPGSYVTLDGLYLECGDWKTYNCGDQGFNFSSVNGPELGTTSGGKQPFHMAGNFAQFQPGPGRIRMTTTVHLIPERGGFAGVTATFQDNLMVPITWTI